MQMKYLVSVSLVLFVVFFSPDDDKVLQVWILLRSLAKEYDSAGVSMQVSTARLYTLLLFLHPLH